MKPVAWMLKSGHGTQFREGATNPIPGLEWNGKPAWVPVFASPPSPRYEPIPGDELLMIFGRMWSSDMPINLWAYDFARVVEAEVLKRLGVKP